MNDQNDDAQNYALMVLAGVVAFVIGPIPRGYREMCLR